MSITKTINLEQDYLIAEQQLSSIDNYYYQWQIERFKDFNDAPITILAIHNLLLKKYIVIGWGYGGGALKSVNQDIVVKIGQHQIISKEIEIIQNFNDIILTSEEEQNNEKLPFVQYENLSIKKYTTASLLEQFPEILDMNYIDNEKHNYLSYSMPFLGKDFMEFFCSKYSYNHFTKFWCAWEKPPSYNGVETIRVSELQMYTLAWMNLINNVRTLHNHNYTHGDIKENNMIYKVETNEFILIDFDQSQNMNKITNDDVEKYNKKYKKNMDINQYIEMIKIDDLIQCITVFFNCFIYYSFGNLYIYTELYKNKVLLINENGNRRDKHFIKTQEYINSFIEDINSFVMNLDIDEPTVKVPDNTFTDSFSKSDKELRIVPDIITRKLELLSRPGRRSKVSKRMSFFNIGSGSGKKKGYDYHSKSKKRDNKIHKYYTRKL